LTLQKLQQQGKIRHIGITNFDTQKVQEFLNAGVTIKSIQLQYSLLDNRPEQSMLQLCKNNDIQFLCYGVLAGGFLSDFWLNQPEPNEAENRSLTKYKLIIDDFGGWDIFQNLLQTLDTIAKKHSTTISSIATKYILDKDNVAGTILGSRNTKHIQTTAQICEINLGAGDKNQIQTALNTFQKLEGDCYHLERNVPRHSGIMKYNLNQK
jgi:aryl-alcohol dehydrogenase-like predicted oxidoreductase